MTSFGATPFLQYWVAARPIRGQSQSGDQYLVAHFDGGTLIAVVDGLGHGDDAAYAAKEAVATLAAHAHYPVVSLMQLCHEALRRTRGAVMSIASYNAAARALTWIGVGNVEGMLLRGPAAENDKRDSLLLRGGIVGGHLPTLLPVTLPVYEGDVLLFATDGIGSAFMRERNYAEQPGILVNHIFRNYAKTTDDALILGAQWREANTASLTRES